MNLKQIYQDAKSRALTDALNPDTVMQRLQKYDQKLIKHRFAPNERRQFWLSVAEQMQKFADSIENSDHNRWQGSHYQHKLENDRLATAVSMMLTEFIYKIHFIF